MSEEFDEWARTNMVDDTGYIEAYGRMEQAYLAGAAAMREKAAEVANSMAIDCPSDKCPEFTDMDDCMYKETGFCIVAAIRKIEVE